MVLLEGKKSDRDIATNSHRQAGRQAAGRCILDSVCFSLLILSIHSFSIIHGDNLTHETIHTYIHTWHTYRGAELPAYQQLLIITIILPKH